MGSRQTSNLSQFLRIAGNPTPGSPPRTRQQCLEQILWAFFDIADRDDIHQAAARLGFVQKWIGVEASRAAADPVFAVCSRLANRHNEISAPQTFAGNTSFSKGVRG